MPPTRPEQPSVSMLRAGPAAYRASAADRRRRHDERSKTRLPWWVGRFELRPAFQNGAWRRLRWRSDLRFLNSRGEERYILPGRRERGERRGLSQGSPELSQPSRKSLTASPAGALACSTAPGRCDAWHCTAGGARATIQPFTAVPQSTSTASIGSPLGKGAALARDPVCLRAARVLRPGRFSGRSRSPRRDRHLNGNVQP
jgi:hypothetical protein